MLKRFALNKLKQCKAYPALPRALCFTGLTQLLLHRELQYSYDGLYSVGDCKRVKREGKQHGNGFLECKLVHALPV